VINCLALQGAEQASSLAETKSTLQELFQMNKVLVARQDQLSFERSTKPQIERGSAANSDPSRLIKAISTMYVTPGMHRSQLLINS
jgi:hypothetical protein